MYSGNGTYRFTYTVTLPAAAGGEARRKAMHLEDTLRKEAGRMSGTVVRKDD